MKTKHTQRISWGIILLIFLLNTPTAKSMVPQSKRMEIISPKGNIKVSLELKSLVKADFGQVYFDVTYLTNAKTINVIPFSPLGLSRKDQKFVDNLTLVNITKATKIVDEYQLIHGKKKICKNEGTEKTFRFMNPEKKILDIIFRVYNNGVAFRYSFPEQSDSTYKLNDETTSFNIPEGTKRWMQPYSIGYEDFYSLNSDGKGIRLNQQWGFPALINVKDQPLWVLISEANIGRSNCATKLSNKDDLAKYKITMPEKEISFSLPWKSQWRVLMIGKLSDIVESTLITDLSEPSKITETEWIKPGIVSWIYWANNHGSKDYQKVVEYVDMAVEMRWPYVLIDWEWDVMTNGGNIVDAVNYAKSKGIKPLMWYNSGTTGVDATPIDRLLTAQKRSKEFTWLNEIGVYGIKVDFFAGDNQKMMNYYIDLLEDAAKYHLMVNFHGATIPRGWDRTYPNLMSVEGVYGAEWYNNKPVLTNAAGKHNTTLPFTRNVVGPMDYTPVTFSNSQYPHITSYGHELALSIIFESGLQHFADRPSAYQSLPSEPKNFLKSVPTAWDETKLIDGYPGVKVVMARRNGKQWYIGGINGNDEAQTLSIDFSFLGKGVYNLELIKDGLNDKSFESEIIKVKKGDIIKVNCLPRGGFVGVLKDGN